MTKNRIFIFIALSAVILLFTYIKKENAKLSYIDQKKEILIFEKEAKELGVLQNKHKDKKSLKKLIKTLIAIKSPTKDYKKTNVRVLEFENINKRVLNRLLKKIQNSSLELRKLDIIRQTDSEAKVRVEFKI